MSNTINNAIPFAVENAVDPAAGLNIAINTVDALLQVFVQSVGLNAPPAGVAGQRFIVGTAPTGAWAGQANKLARFLDGAWQFFDARYVVNAADGRLYLRSGATWLAYGGSDTGWVAGQGTPNKSAFNAATATTTQVASRLLAIENALFSIGVLRT